MSILIVDDDQELIKTISPALCQEKFKIEKVYRAQEALDKIRKNEYELAIIDWFFRDEKINGKDLIRELLKSKKQTPIIMLSGYNSLAHKVRILNQGVDDYVTKPFYLRELMARVKSLLRRNTIVNKKSGEIKIGPLSLDLDFRQIICENKIIDLSIKEFQILSILFEKRNIVVTRLELITKIWHSSNQKYWKNAINVNIRNIRQKIKPYDKIIVTINKIGYYLNTKSLLEEENFQKNKAQNSLKLSDYSQN